MFKNIYHFVVDKKIPTLAGCLAFNFILNGGSFLFLYIVLSSFFANNFNDLFLANIADGKIKELISYFLSYQNGIPYSIFLLITSLYSASSLYYCLISVVELITQIHYDLSYSKRFLSIMVTIIYLIGLNLITFISTEIILFLNYLFQILFILLIFIIFCLTIYLVNVVAMRDYHFKRIYKGLIFTILYFIIFTSGFIIYLRLFSNFKIVYGILSFFIILFFYIYVLAIGILLGIYLNYKNINLAYFVKTKECEEVKV